MSYGGTPKSSDDETSPDADRADHADHDTDGDHGQTAGQHGPGNIALRAPSATRMPSSRVRCETRYDVTP